MVSPSLNAIFNFCATNFLLTCFSGGIAKIYSQIKKASFWFEVHLWLGGFRLICVKKAFRFSAYIFYGIFAWKLKLFTET